MFNQALSPSTPKECGPRHGGPPKWPWKVCCRKLEPCAKYIFSALRSFQSPCGRLSGCRVIVTYHMPASSSSHDVRSQNFKCKVPHLPRRSSTFLALPELIGSNHDRPKDRKKICLRNTQEQSSHTLIPGCTSMRCLAPVLEKMVTGTLRSLDDPAVTLIARLADPWQLHSPAH
jgi:hypothetical protein